MGGTAFETTTRLNLRTGPGTDEPIILTLPEGQRVTLLDDFAEVPSWWQVETELPDGRRIGFVHQGFLRALEAEQPLPPPTPAAGGGPEAHLPNLHGRPVPRSGENRAHRLLEEGAPTGSPSAELLWRIVDWLDVEKPAHRRWQPGSVTYCNVYAHDVAVLYGRYLPRVWWSAAALAEWRAGRTAGIVYGDTVREMRANDLHDWLDAEGQAFGWERVGDLSEAQEAANAGALATLCATTGSAKPGHITMLLAERPGEGQVAQRDGGRVVAPLQSQAGRHNRRAFAAVWWASSGFKDWGVWANRG